MRPQAGIMQLYTDWAGSRLARYWVTNRLLVGGSILDTNDYQLLHRNNDVGPVLTLTAHYSDKDRVPEGLLCSLPFDDDGKPVPHDLIHRALSFAQTQLADESRTMYVHCAAGLSRSPSMAYAICRGIFNMPAAAILPLIAVSNPFFDGNPNTVTYRACIEEALKTWGHGA